MRRAICPSIDTASSKYTLALPPRLSIRADATVSIVAPRLNMDENETNLSGPRPSSR